MWSFALVINGIFNVIFAPFKGMHPAVGLLVISVATGIVMLLIFGKTSNQRAIRQAKGKLKAHISEIWLFRDDLPQMLIAFFRVLGNTERHPKCGFVRARQGQEERRVLCGHSHEGQQRLF